MAFRIKASAIGEFRRSRTQNGKDGKEYWSFNYEDAEGESHNISVRNAEHWEDVQELRKGEIYCFPLLFVSGGYGEKSYAYVVLDGQPVPAADGDGVIL